ncbi:MAG: hypothetical protein IJF65_09020, partial [Clostridia bacterium]|nr:hypothetical protein [Clostridia bacterium]
SGRIRCQSFAVIPAGMAYYNKFCGIRHPYSLRQGQKGNIMVKKHVQLAEAICRKESLDGPTL